MLDKIFRWLLTVIGLVLGYALAGIFVRLDFFHQFINFNQSSISLIIFYIVCILLFGLMLYVIAPFIIKILWNITGFLEGALQKIPTNDIILSVGGLIIGLIVANLFIGAVTKFISVASSTILAVIGSIISLLVNIIFATLGVNIALKKKEDLYNIFTFMKKFGKDKKNKGEAKTFNSQPKILDTSVIIDGRILDILKTGFIEGPIVIPSFVLEELRHIADSSDSLKRTRGRRGLDILNLIQKELGISVEICERNFENIQEVDSKLLKLAQALGGKVITNDFNLNKVAEFQGVSVLNINELANAVKPIVIPGEDMHIQIIKDGKETGQGVAYLDDGTMIVVEGGKKYVGDIVDVTVTSVLQTAAGRMIFAKIKNAQDKAV
ncbi:PIN/TRAM domain-containing protein [Caloramator sp. E03]|uniref:PIN/TRAM domain-containing protein n=1 Tax=Caloramator sp. E03 TaxID=2576307 RepID=UPI0011105756|nr:PIN/TRAM domain-containing protein [Caloramator sp. E03]QCX33809.1 PIN/TRAM domain-containing protein [Caloramator sp. E03]